MAYPFKVGDRVWAICHSTLRPKQLYICELSSKHCRGRKPIDMWFLNDELEMLGEKNKLKAHKTSDLFKTKEELINSLQNGN